MTKRGTISNYDIIAGIAIISILVLGSLFLSVTTYGLAWSNITKNGNVSNNIQTLVLCLALQDYHHDFGDNNTVPPANNEATVCGRSQSNDE